MIGRKTRTLYVAEFVARETMVLGTNGPPKLSGSQQQKQKEDVAAIMRKKQEAGKYRLRHDTNYFAGY